MGTVGRQIAGSLARGRGGYPVFFIDIFAPGHANRREGILKYVLRRPAYPSTYELNTVAENAIDFDVEVHRDADFFSPIGSNADRIEILKAGTYRVTYNVVGEAQDTSWANVETGVCKNTSTLLLSPEVGSTGALYLRHSNRPKDSASASFIAEYSANDYVRVKHIRAGGVSSGQLDRAAFQVELLSYPDEENLGGQAVATSSGKIVEVIALRGVAGDTGTSTVNVKKNGTTIMASSPTIDLGASDDLTRFPGSDLADQEVATGDRFTIDFDSEESPYGRDWLVRLVVQRS